MVPPPRYSAPHEDRAQHRYRRFRAGKRLVADRKISALALRQGDACGLDPYQAGRAPFSRRIRLVGLGARVEGRMHFFLKKEAKTFVHLAYARAARSRFINKSFWLSSCILPGGLDHDPY
jgi:hypothetical protein